MCLYGLSFYALKQEATDWYFTLFQPKSYADNFKWKGPPKDD